MRKVLLATAALVVAVVFFALFTLPSPPRRVDARVDPDVQRRTVGGAYHVHSTRSDGAGSKDAIAAAASRAGLAFVILTDHGDGTRPPDPAVYLHGVLCIDAVEISTDGGHYVALDMKPSPYPLGGEPSAVVEDVHRLGGFGVAAHPDSPRAELKWTDWNAPIDGLEWLSADSEWRDESRASLARVLAGYFLRPGPSLALILDRPLTTLQRWSTLAATRPIVGLAAQDAHGGIGRGAEEGGARRAAIGGVPSYEASFRTFSNRVVLEAPLNGDAATAARQVLEAIERGRVFTVVDALATPGYVELREADTHRELPIGSVDAIQEGGVVSFTASRPEGSSVSAVATGDRGEVTSHSEDAFRLTRGATRFEVSYPGAPGMPPVPWLVTNPVYVHLPPAPVLSVPADIESGALPEEAAWHLETDPASKGTVATNGRAVSFTYTLGAGDRASQFAAAATDLAGVPDRFERILLTASATRPGRLSVQLRYPPQGLRWGTSVYVDPTPRALRVALDRMRPLDRQTGPAPGLARAGALLLVVDLTNARPGDSSEVHVSDVRFAR